MTTEGCKSVTDNLWFSSISPSTPLWTHTSMCQFTANIQICVTHAKKQTKQCPDRLQPIAAVHIQHKLPVYYGSFCVGVLKSHRFPLRTCRWIYLHQGKRREDRNNCAIFILFEIFQYKHWFYWIWSHGMVYIDQTSAIHRERLLHLSEKRSCFGSSWISCCASQRFQQIHLSLYTYMQPIIIIIMYIFSKWISSNRI